MLLPSRSRSDCSFSALQFNRCHHCFFLKVSKNHEENLRIHDFFRFLLEILVLLGELPREVAHNLIITVTDSLLFFFLKVVDNLGERLEVMKFFRFLLEILALPGELPGEAFLLVFLTLNFSVLELSGKFF